MAGVDVVGELERLKPLAVDLGSAGFTLVLTWRIERGFDRFPTIRIAGGPDVAGLAPIAGRHGYRVVFDGGGGVVLERRLPDPD